ncbi:MAG: hypothetical protein PHN49_00780 [Candidatus Omnitrophica bacterium]|nr:hypothetical protein [Candidatus Omnitrophota bacterium]MDD5670157.1 hypothetical protein [Candidatus Omnitrophota bacterium]
MMSENHHGKISVKGFAFAAAMLWGGAVFFVGLANLQWPGYGKAFLDLVASVYPGYEALPTLKSLLIGTAYAIVDGTIGGSLFALLYNLCVGCQCRKDEKK